MTGVNSIGLYTIIKLSAVF